MNKLQLSKVEEFKQAFARGMESIVSASEIYVQAIDENPNMKDVFIAECADFIPASAWSGFEAVGRKWLHPKLLMGGGGKYASKIKRLAYSDQEAVFSGKRFEMLTAEGQVLKVDIRQVEPDQADQLFDGTHIRTMAEQKAFIEARKSKPAEEVDVMPYVITDGKVSFRRGVALNKTEMRRILQEM